MEDLPIELLQLIGFFYLDDPRDLLSFALTSKTIHQKLLADNEYDRDQHRAMAGIWYCLLSDWERAACMAVQRGLGSVTRERFVPDQVFERTPLEHASFKGFGNVVRALLRRPEIDPRDDDQWIFEFACSWEKIDIIRILVEDGRIDPTYDGNSLLYEAVELGNQKTVDFLFSIPEVRQKHDEMTLQTHRT